MKNCNNNNYGFTLMELIITLVIISILILITIPSFVSYITIASNSVCSSNKLELYRMYELHLIVEDIEKNDAIFESFVQVHGQNICPNNGVVSVVNGRIQCELHYNDKSNDDSDDEVPYL